jgi:hypothetical protein
MFTETPPMHQHHGHAQLSRSIKHGRISESAADIVNHLSTRSHACSSNLCPHGVDADRYAGVVKKTRAPRKKRAVSVEKQLKHLKFMKESNEYKLASINPEKILGAQELWCFNAKYRTVTVFRALDRGGLKVNRSSIAGYDENTSVTRGTGRQTEKVIDKIMNGGKIILKKVMDELKGNQALQERINENTILLKVVS